MQSQSVAPRWVDVLFSRLAVRYADAWLRKWDGLPMEDVKADWQRALKDIFERHPDAIAYALDNLPEWPPTCDAFARICRNAPSKRLALEAPTGRRDPARMAELMQRLKTALESRPDSRIACLRALEAREAAGTLSGPQKAQLQALRQVTDAAAPVMGSFAEIPKADWPWVKRGQAPMSVSP
jgi:hypothetical protein